MKISVVDCQAPRRVQEWELELSSGASAEQALRACGLYDDRFKQPGPEPLLGIWGRRCTLDAVLDDGDRLELYRPLRVDPKEARRERFVGQGVRSAGLFAKRRAGAKPGY